MESTSLTAGGAAEVSWVVQDQDGIRTETRSRTVDQTVGKSCDQCGAVETSETGPLVYFPSPNLDYQTRLKWTNRELID